MATPVPSTRHFSKDPHRDVPMFRTSTLNPPNLSQCAGIVVDFILIVILVVVTGVLNIGKQLSQFIQFPTVGFTAWYGFSAYARILARIFPVSQKFALDTNSPHNCTHLPLSSGDTMSITVMG